MKPLSWPRLLAFSSFGFALTLISNTLDPAIYGHLVLRLAPNNPNTLLGFSTAAASILAIFVAPIVGAWSDRTNSRWGKRKPFFLLGVPVLIVALYAIGLAPSIPIFVAGVLLYRLGDNLIFPPWEALYSDHVPGQQRGLASGFKALTDILAVLVGRFAAGELMARAVERGNGAVVLAVSVPVVGLLFAVLATWIALRGLVTAKSRTGSFRPPAGIRESFSINWKAHQDFLWWFINRILFWTGFVILGQFLLLFVIDVIGLGEADAQRYLARLSLVLGGAILLVAVPSGRLADRIGRKPLIIAACALAAIGTVMVLIVRDLNWLTVAAALVGLGSGIYISSNFALLTDIVPAADAGKFLGLSNIAGAGGGAIARLLGGLLIDPINAATGSRAAGYLVLYTLAAVLFAASTWAALRLIDESKSKPGRN